MAMNDPPRIENRIGYTDAFGQQVMQLVETDRPDPTRPAVWQPGSEQIP